MKKRHVVINSIRDQIDYVTNMSRYWISQDDWDMANVYIDKCITLQERYDNAVKYYQQANLRETLILD